MQYQANLRCKYSRLCYFYALYYYRLTTLNGYAIVALLMKLLAYLMGENKKKEAKTLAEYQRELMVKKAKQQFEKLQAMGLTIPVQLT